MWWRQFPCPLSHGHRLLVTRRLYTSTHHICIQGRKMKRRKVGASTICLLPTGKKNAFHNQPHPNESRLRMSHWQERGHIASPSWKEGRRKQEFVFPLPTLQGQEKLYATSAQLNVTWALDGQREGKVTREERCKYKNRESDLGLDPNFAWRIAGSIDWKASWDMDCSGILISTLKAKFHLYSHVLLFLYTHQPHSLAPCFNNMHVLITLIC